MKLKNKILFNGFIFIKHYLQFLRFIFFLFSVFLFSNCANQLPPGGGEIDKIPPSIIDVFPKNNTTNYNQNFFEITFTEYVDKRSVQEAIFISPPLLRGLEYDWSGKSLEVFFKDSLKQNTTYTITIGAEVEDINNRNKMVEPFTFAFSTGATIDTGKVSGKIYDKDPSGTMVFAYLEKDSVADPVKEKPDYVSQVGKNGKYKLLGLSEGNYKIFAIRDRYRDFLYNPNEDDYGVQFKEVSINSELNEIINCDFYLTIEDTLPPKLSSVIMKDKDHFLLEFTEPIDSSKISSSNFFIYDSTRQKRIDIKTFFKGEARDKQYNLSFSDSLKGNNQNYLICENIEDLFGNINKYESFSITPRYEVDTLAPKLLKISGVLPDEKVDFEKPVLSVKFNDGIMRDSVLNSVIIEDSKGVNIKNEIQFIDDASFMVNINSKLKQRSEYYIKIDLNKIIDVAGNKVDSTYKQKFTTNSELDFSGISGFIQNSEGDSLIFVQLKNIDNPKFNYNERANKDKTFSINKVIPGKYILSSFIDKDENKKYTHGTIKPFKLSEKFVVYPDTLNLRARWPVGDVQINY